jgi:hypothetical protein
MCLIQFDVARIWRWKGITIMKNLVIIVVLALVGAAGAYAYVKWSQSQKTKETALPAGHSANDGHDHGDEAGEEAHADLAAASGENVVLCVKHRIPETADAFCHPELIEKLGFCKGHDVPEAFCTRCSPSLIPAFKAENDWCAEHSLPESQCKLCKAG